MKILKVISTALLLSILVFSLGFLGSYLAVGPDIPNVDTLEDIRLQTPMRIYDRNDQLISEFGGIRRIPVSLDQVPKQFIEALIATEDQRFYEHSGVDFMGVGRAALNLITTGRKSQGASTITMLVARNYFLSRIQTFKRKITEIFLAWKIERELNKDQILELLLNKIEFGHRALGIGAAAQVYYGRPLKELALPELAVLAGIPKGQSKYNPISYPKNAFARRNHVLKRMLVENYITESEYEASIKVPITSTMHRQQYKVQAPYFGEMVRKRIIEKYGIQDAYNAGLKVYTTLDPNLQDVARKSLRAGIVAYGERHGYHGAEGMINDYATITEEALLERLELIPEIGDLLPAVVTSVDDLDAEVLLASGERQTLFFEHMQWARPFISVNRRGPEPDTVQDILAIGQIVRVYKNKGTLHVNKEEGFEDAWMLSQLPRVNGALVAIEPENGAIRALVGGFDFRDSKYNRAVQAKRQPGSNMKPFVYSAALNKGFTAASIINDAPYTKDLGDKGFWRPKNSSEKYQGPVTLRYALRRSLNAVSVRLIEEIGVDYTREYLQKFGFSLDRMPSSPTLALGAPAHSPLEIVNAYSIFANGGYEVENYFIEKITDSSGNVLFQAAPKTVCSSCETENEALSIFAIDEPFNREMAQQLAEEIAAETENQSFELDPYATLAPYPPRELPEKQIAPRVVDERNVYIMTRLMRDIIQRGTGFKARALGRTDLSGKTGTTNENIDAWFSGFNKKLAVSVWIGYDDNTQSLGNREYGAKAALPVWIDFMRKALADIPNQELEQPPGIVLVKIDPKTGEPANVNPLATSHEFEYFRIENAPGGVAAQTNDEPLIIDDEEDEIELF